LFRPTSYKENKEMSIGTDRIKRLTRRVMVPVLAAAMAVGIGAYELAKLIIQGLIDDKLPIAQQVVEDWKPFDPSHPDAESDFHVPPSITYATAKPFGS